MTLRLSTSETLVLRKLINWGRPADIRAFLDWLTDDKGSLVEKRKKLREIGGTGGHH